MLKVLSVLGTRPEAIKMAPVIKSLGSRQNVESLVCVTAQHREMLDQVLTLFEIEPDIDLNLMKPEQTLSEISASIFTHLDPVMTSLRPDWVLIQGDTTTAMITALLSYFHHIRVGHVEAGLRTLDKWQPFPEEINRRVASAVADLHFAPTEWSRQNLIKENVNPEKIVVTGNPVIDALQQISKRPPTPEIHDLFLKLGLVEGKASGGHSLSQTEPKLILVTAHRRENFGKPLERICQALKTLAEIYVQKIRIVYPVHLNPNVHLPVHQMLGNQPNILLLSPLNYLPMVHLLKKATLVLTDSGGLQEEAPGLGVPVLVLREVTERPEGVEAGTVRLVGTDTERIISEARCLLEDEQAYSAMANAVNPYGDGHAAERIVEALLAS